MSDLKEEVKYRIVLAAPWAPPPFPIGANNEGGPTDLVVIGGQNNVWTVRRLEDGNYNLILEQDGTRWLSKPAGDNVVVEIMPLPGEWKIQRHENDSYSIEVPSDRWPTKAWTLANSVHGTPVTLGTYELPRPGQLWNFHPV